MKLKAISALFALFMAFALLGVALAQSVDEVVRDIAEALNCPVCENLSVADSPSELAKEMKALVREKVEQGQSREEILNYFVSRYGEAILREPPKRGFALMVWLGPIVGLAIGAGILYFFLREWSRQRGAHPELSEASEEDVGKYAERLKRELKRSGGEPF